MQKYITLFFSVLLFAACKQKEQPPPNIIEETRMIKLLTALHIADGEMFTVTPVPDTLYKYGRLKYDAFFKAHHVTEKQFNDSFKFYTEDPEKIQAMYDQIDKALKAKLDSVNKIPAKNNVVPQ